MEAQHTFLGGLRHLIWRLSGYGVLAGFVLAIGVPLLFLAISAIDWLKYGVWRESTNAEALEWGGGRPPNFQWAGLQEVANWILDSPFWWTAMAVGCVLFFGCLKILELTETRRRQ